ncbi:helix-turn-helix transcriptional regulator [Marinobacterium nitratireducens]|nr:helix-turn-helix transcriptional regulator [Marinobacterium nitratireducens]
MNKLKHYRKEKGLTQTQLGALLKTPISQGAVGHHETGARTPDVYVAAEYAAILGVSVEELFPAPEMTTAA